ncbi:MAG: glycosyltransferase, partial [Planctomycetota bacterium]
MTDGSRQRRPRVLMVSRYFWPLGCFDGAVHLMAIARGLSECGFHVDVLTPKYHTEWAESFRFRDISVYRPVRAPKVGWKKAFDRGTTRYIDFLTQWLLSHGGGYDVLYCDSAREEAISTVAAAKELGLKCMVRVAGLGTASDLEWMNSSRFGKRIVGALSLADLVVVGDADAERSWHTFGIRGPKLARIRSGVYPSELEDKQDLRSAFARINGDLFVPSGSQVALSVERHDASSGVMQLANAAVGLSREAPSLHYWFVGDGANRDAVYSRLRGDGLRQSFVMPGSFGLIQDVFQAADFLIQTGEAGFDALVPAAIEAGLPIVLANNAAAR